MELNISNIQHFSVGDGPGIRTTVFVKGCNLRCPWCHNPETISTKPQTLHYEEVNQTVTSGTLMTVEEILEDVLCDSEFYIESEGGVTLSGGEVMLQAEGAMLLAKSLQEKGISVWVDTAGDVPYEKFQRMNPYVDGYLFDYKSPNATKYKEVIGGNWERIIENLGKLIKDGMDVRVRIPLIPDFNFNMDTVNEMCDHLKEIGCQTVDLLPFHRMGSGKYRALGLQYKYAEMEPLSKNQVEPIKTIFEQAGFRVNIE